MKLGMKVFPKQKAVFEMFLAAAEQDPSSMTTNEDGDMSHPLTTAAYVKQFEKVNFYAKNT